MKKLRINCALEILPGFFAAEAEEGNYALILMGLGAYLP